MSLTGLCNVPSVLSVPHIGHAALTTYTENKAGRSCQLSQKEPRQAPDQVPADSHPEVIPQQRNSWLFRDKGYIVVAPSC